jgi:IclR family transcriptional regulator, acetate operon repressor
MLNDQSEITIKRARRVRAAAAADRSLKRPRYPYDYNVKSATRALEVIELFGVHRHPLSVTEIATALAIPQSSSSVLLHALSSIGFVTRDRKTRKYAPGIRSVFLGNWIHDAIFPGGSLLGALDALSRDASANVRLGVRSGTHVRYVHVSWPDNAADRLRLTPGMILPVCQDALGRALLATETDRDVCGIVRRANAEKGATVVGVEGFMEELRAQQKNGYAECDDWGFARERVLAIPLRAPFGIPAAIGIGIQAERLPVGRQELLRLLHWVGQNIAAEAPCGSAVRDALE